MLMTQIKIMKLFMVNEKEVETRGLNENITKTKLMVIGREPAVRSQRG